MLAGAGELGGMAAGWLMEFLALPDYDLGNKLGYLAGMILLEALIAYFTAGGYLVIKEGASIGARLLAYFLRFLDMGGAILGILGKGLGQLRWPVMGGLDAAGRVLSRFKFLEKVMGRVRGAADWLFSFGDEIGHAADLARRGPVDDAAGRGVMGLADDAAEGVARGGMRFRHCCQRSRTTCRPAPFAPQTTCPQALPASQTKPPKQAATGRRAMRSTRLTASPRAADWTRPPMARAARLMTRR